MKYTENPLVFRVELPLCLAPVLNLYASLKRRRWKLGEMNADVDKRILSAKQHYPNWKMDDLKVTRSARIVKGKLRPIERREGGRCRRVVVTRYSSREPDEISVDAVGGKLPVDRLKHAEIIRDDSRAWCQREAYWVQAPPKKGKVVVEVHDLREM